MELAMKLMALMVRPTPIQSKIENGADNKFLMDGRLCFDL